LKKAFAAACAYVFCTVALASNKIICQSELLKRNASDSWDRAIFYDSDSFEITLKSKELATLTDKSIGKVECTLSDSRIICKHESKSLHLALWSINRITGVYESYTSFQGQGESKVRGICSKSNQMKF
jgi:hypothetical protein